MTTEEKEIKANTASQAADDRPTAELTDLPVAVEQTEEVKGGYTKGTTNCVIFFER